MTDSRAAPRRSPSSAQPGAAIRAAAARALAQVRAGQSLTRVLQAAPSPAPDTSPADVALFRELVQGAVRQLSRLEALAGRLLERPLPPTERELDALILIGLHQLTATRVPPHAAVAATVEASRLLRRPGKTALVNALLRRFQREREPLLAAIDADETVRWLCPRWLIERLRQDWPTRWDELLATSNGRAPMSLRVNTMRITRAQYLDRLAAAGKAARPLPGLPRGLVLDQPLPSSALPGFREGLVSIQDGGAQWAAELLDAAPGMRVLDACAAPGGKTAGLLERAGGPLDLVALESDGERLEQVAQTLSRLGLTATLIQGDASAPQGSWIGDGFDRILLDVPCSATGVIRRHPDIKWLRRPEDIPALCATQARMLDACWRLLRPGGWLLYATCSLLAAENQDQIADFLARHADARERPWNDLAASAGAPPWSLALAHGRQVPPTPDGPDGFYYALLERAAADPPPEQR